MKAMILLAALAIAAPAPTAPTITGQATVIDGDTIRVGKTTIRLFGIDAPEADQRCDDAEGRPYNCGLLAADVLMEEIGGAEVSCVTINIDRYGRTVAVCQARGRDLGDAMVRRGYAVDVPFYSGGRYSAAEKEAKEARRGLWSGVFMEPRQWRMEKRR
jgi:endonuclease YncB( thermonuclease family)